MLEDYWGFVNYEILDGSVVEDDVIDCEVSVEYSLEFFVKFFCYYFVVELKFVF